MPADASAVQREHFNHIAERYVAGRSDERHLAYADAMWSFVIARIRALIKPVPGMLGLEAMCGTAGTSRRLLAAFPGLAMDAFDYSDEMVARAATSPHPRLRVFQQDILTLADEGRYDVVVLVGGLHHVPDHVPAALRNLRRVLKPGGWLVNLEPTHNNIAWRLVRERIYARNSLFDAGTERGFDLSSYDALLVQSGFEMVWQHHPGLLGYVLYYNPDAFPCLARGGPAMARAMWRWDRALGGTQVGRIASFATWTIARSAS